MTELLRHRSPIGSSPDSSIERFYFAHPVLGDAKPANDEERAAIVIANLRRARRWIGWLLRELDVAIECSWVTYCEVLPESPEWRTRGMRDNCLSAMSCDGIILCGGYLSSGMRTEAQAVLASRRLFCRPDGTPSKVILDLLDLGPEPPAGDVDLLDDLGRRIATMKLTGTNGPTTAQWISV